jgi:hypothetical protein
MISSGYEFAELSFQFWFWTPSNFAALILTNHICANLYLASNVNCVKYDHQGNRCTIKFDVNNKTLVYPYYELYTSIKVIVKNFTVENFLQD